jgi:hypothetical protein
MCSVVSFVSEFDIFPDSRQSLRSVIQQPSYHSVLFLLFSYWQCFKTRNETRRPVCFTSLFVRDCTCPFPLFVWCDITNSIAVRTSHETTVLHNWAVRQEAFSYMILKDETEIKEKERKHCHHCRVMDEIREPLPGDPEPISCRPILLLLLHLTLVMLSQHQKHLKASDALLLHSCQREECGSIE